MPSLFKKIFSKKNRKQKNGASDDQPLMTVNFPFDVDNDHLQRIITEFRKPWVDKMSPWATSNDHDFLTKIEFSSTIASKVAMRSSLSVTDKHRCDWNDSPADLSKVNRPAVEKVYKLLLNTNHFKFKLFNTYNHKAIMTGLEGVFVEYKKLFGWYCPTDVHHVDNRRFRYYIADSDLKQNRLLGIRDGVDMDVRPLSKQERLNMIISIYKPFEFTFGYGLGEFNKIYFLWRFIAFLEELMQLFTEKFTVPFVAVSAHPALAPATGGANAGAKLQSILDSYLQQFKKMKAGNFFSVPTPANIQMIDIGKDKLKDMRELHMHLQKIAADCVMGAGDAQMAKSKTYGANRSQTQLAMQFIHDDREFLEERIAVLMERVYYLNEGKFRELGVESFYHLPKVRLVYAQPDVELEIKKFTAIREAGYDYTVETLEHKFDVDLARDENGEAIRRDDSGEEMEDIKTAEGD